MGPFLAEPAHRHGAPRRSAVLLVNLGTPAAATPAALRRYLRQFLSDPRVVEIPRVLWWLILNGIILNTRPAKSAKKYAAIWTPEGSPLKAHTEAQAKLLKGLMGNGGDGDLLIDWAMRYGTPSIADRLTDLRAQGAERILIVPLYPQYAASTTASVMDDVAAWMQRTRHLPEIRWVKHFHDHPAYVTALAASIREHWQAHGPLGPQDRLVISFHGLPKRSLDLGDPYYCECQKTARLLTTALRLDPARVAVTFQSRFGRAEWLQPYTQSTLETLPSQGVRRVDVICPGFVSDCLETLEEINLECRHAFMAAGGDDFHYIPCLNRRPDWIRALADIIQAAGSDWLGTLPPDPETLARAQALGAPQ